jgi:hypothetical protein
VTTLSPAQIGHYAYAAGFRGKGLRDAIAVALAESGGNTHAVGTNSDTWRSRDRGLWQINDHWHKEVSDAAAFNPSTAAAAAYRISAHGTDWHQWSTWHSGAAQAQFGRAQMAANQAAGSAASTGTTAQNADFPLIPGVPNLPGIPGIEDLVKAFATGGAGGAAKALLGPFLLMVKAGAWIADPHNWQRVVMVTGGTVGVLLALEMIGKSGAAGSTAQSITAIPGKALKETALAGAAVATDGASLAVTGGGKVAKAAGSAAAKSAAATKKAADAAAKAAAAK